MKKILAKAILVMALGVATVGFAAECFAAGMPIMVKAAGHTVQGELLDNATAKALADKMPMAIKMFNAHDIEMVHRFEEALPAEEVGHQSFEIGDLFYWTPKHAFVIYYDQNHKSFDNLQKIGHLNGDVSFFKDVQEARVLFVRGE